MGIIEFKDVSFQYPNGFSAVENVSFEINEGEAIAIIGQNGAGKTTTVKMINGLLKPTHGTVLIDGMVQKIIQQHNCQKSQDMYSKIRMIRFFIIMSKMKLDLDLKNKDYQKKKL